MFRKTFNLLGIQKGETRLALASASLSFFIGFSLIFLCSYSTALFLTHFNAADLGFVYIGVAISISLCGFLFSLFEGRVSQRVLSVGTLVFLLLFLVGFVFWLRAGGEKTASFFLLIWFEVAILLTSLSFWGLCGSLFSLGQAKRLFGLIDSGKFIAYMGAGYLSPFIASHFGAGSFLYLSCIGVVLAIILTFFVRDDSSDKKKTKKTSQGMKTQKKSRKKKSSFRELSKDKFVLNLHLLWGLSIAAIYLADVAMNSQAELRFTDSGELAGFFGLFYGVAAFAALVVKGFASGRIIGKIGVVKALYLLPVALLFINAILSAFKFIPASVSTVFALAVALKFVNYVLDHGIKVPAFMVLYQPFSASQRMSVQTSVESLAGSGSILLAGIILLAGRKYVEINAVNVSWIMAGIILVWLFCTITLRKQYTAKLTQAMKHMLRKGEVNFSDSLSMGVVMQKLETGNPEEVSSCLDIIASQSPEKLQQILPGLLVHPSEKVVVEALQRVEGLRSLLGETSSDFSVSPELTKNVEALLMTDKNAEITSTALKALASTQGEGAIETLLPYMENTDRSVRIGATVGIMKYTGGEGLHAAGVRLVNMLHSRDEMDREAFALALGEIGKSGFYRPLLDLLEDESMNVRKAAATASAKLGNRRLASGIVNNIRIRELRGGATKALSAIGGGALDAVSLALDNNGHDRVFSRIVIKSISKMDGPESISYLENNLSAPDPYFRGIVLNSLTLRRYKAANRETIKVIIRREAEFAFWCISAFRELIEEKGVLGEAFFQEAQTTVLRIKSLLTFIYPATSIQHVFRNLDRPEQEQREYAIETFENILEPDLKTIVFSLIVGPAFERTKNTGPEAETFDYKPLGIHGLAETVLSGNKFHFTNWTISAALFEAGVHKLMQLKNLVLSHTRSDEPIIRETALWTSGSRASDPWVSDSWKSARFRSKGGTRMIITVEKTQHLSEAEIFAELPGETLGEVAVTATEEEVESGDIIIQRGEYNDALYILFAGQVKVTGKDEDDVKVLDGSGIFGEFEGFNPGPSTIEASAEEDSILLKLDSIGIETLIEDSPEFAKCVVKYLAGRNRY